MSYVRDHLGELGLARSVVTTTLPPFEHVNVQVALDVWAGADGRDVTVQGVTVPPHHGSLSLPQLMHGDGLPPVRLSAPDLIDLPSGPDQTLACFKTTLLMVGDLRGRYVLFVKAPVPHEEPSLVIEVAGLETTDAQAVLRALADLRSTLNVYRRQLLELSPGPDGMSITFAAQPPTERADVVLPEPVLRRVEKHTIDIATHRDALRAAGQHLKRGLLLYGPPARARRTPPATSCRSWPARLS